MNRVRRKRGWDSDNKRAEKTIEHINNQQPAQIEYSISSYRFVLFFFFSLGSSSFCPISGSGQQMKKNRGIASRNEIVHINCPTEEVSNCESVARLAPTRAAATAATAVCPCVHGYTNYNNNNKWKTNEDR